MSRTNEKKKNTVRLTRATIRRQMAYDVNRMHAGFCRFPSFLQTPDSSYKQQSTLSMIQFSKICNVRSETESLIIKLIRQELLIPPSRYDFPSTHRGPSTLRFHGFDGSWFSRGRIVEQGTALGKLEVLGACACEESLWFCPKSSIASAPPLFTLLQQATYFFMMCLFLNAWSFCVAGD
jgi:hypothetical protein